MRFRLLVMQSLRSCSFVSSGTRQFSEEELQSIVELKRKAERVSSKAVDNLMKTRCWAKAPVLEVSGRVPRWQKPSISGQKFDENLVKQPVVKLRWANSAERDVDILLSSTETYYTVEVKAVLYGIIDAIGWNETKVRMKNTNEVVVKVASGRFSATKEAASFHLITKVVSAPDTKLRDGQLIVKLDKLSEQDKPIKRIAPTTMTENEFFKKYRDSIEKLKQYA